MSYKYWDKYIDLKIKGRLFPSWILANFKDYKLPKIKIDGDDPCTKPLTNELQKYQVFVSKFLDFNSPYKNILLYFGVGAGKTGTVINYYNILYNYTPGWNVFVLLKATLKNHWEKELNKFLETEDKTARRTNIIFISYDSPIADKTFIEEVYKTDTSKKNLFVIEEVHNFISNVYSNISTRKGKRAQIIYDYIMQDQQENHDTRVIALSATPAINNPFELALLFNLLRPGIFPKNEVVFNQEFVSGTSYKILNSTQKNLFQRRIMGLVSYYIGATSDFFPSKTIEYVYVRMSKYHEDIYNYFEGIEERIARKKKKQLSGEESYKSYTRQASNFVFPFMGQGMTGENRPRPKNFAITKKTKDEIDKGKITEKDKEKYYNAKNYINAIEKYVLTFENHINNFIAEDEKNKYTIRDDVKVYHEKYNDNFDDFNNKEEKKSKVYEELYKCSAKMLNIIFNILKIKGPALVYSNYVLMEGIQVFCIYLKCLGFTSALDDGGKDYYRYMEYHGLVKKDDRGKILDIFNKKENMNGVLCKILIISSAGSEGINLKSVRSVHLMEPFWHAVRNTQIEGRAFRFLSHCYLPKEERNVIIFYYRSVRKDYPNAKWTTDEYIDDLARKKQGLIESFLGAIKEIAIDCVLYKNVNMLSQDYKCFQFDEPSLFVDQIGPAYKDDINDDRKMDNGSNSINSKTVSIKVIKIKGVKQLTKEPPIKYSSPEFYWYYPESGVVYDYELYYAIGKVAYDDNHIPQKLDATTYIIDKLIPIPLIKTQSTKI